MPPRYPREAGDQTTAAGSLESAYSLAPQCPARPCGALGLLMEGLLRATERGMESKVVGVTFRDKKRVVQVREKMHLNSI